MPLSHSDWDESKHPRGDHGVWVDSASGSQASGGGYDAADHYRQRDLHAEGVWPDQKDVSGRSIHKSYGGVVFDGQGRVLLRKPTNNFGGYAWTFAKGGPDPGEHPVDAALREVKEETGHNPAIIGHVPGTFRGETSQNNFYLMEASGQSGQTRPNPDKTDSETEALRWATPAEAVKMIGETTSVVGKQRDLKILAAAVDAHRGVMSDRLADRKPAGQGSNLTRFILESMADKSGKTESTLPVGKPPEVSLVKHLGGSTGAKLVKDKAGNQYVQKFGNSAGHLREEFYADSMYRAMGATVPFGRMYETEKGPMKLTEYKGNMTPIGEALDNASPKERKQIIDEVAKHFVLDSLLGNWDVVGMGRDNILIDDDRKAWRIDNGGSLRYRAQGKLKGSGQFGPEIAELKNMRNPDMALTAAEVFRHLTEADLQKQAHDILKNKDKLMSATPEELKPVISQRLDNLKERFGDSKDGKVEFAAASGSKGDLDPDGNWITVNGQHIHVTSDDEIDAGGHPKLREALEKGGLHAKAGDSDSSKSSDGYPENPQYISKAERLKMSVEHRELFERCKTKDGKIKAKADPKDLKRMEELQQIKKSHDAAIAQMPFHEWYKKERDGSEPLPGDASVATMFGEHERLVEQALQAGKHVSDSVLEDHPKVAEAYGRLKDAGKIDVNKLARMDYELSVLKRQPAQALAVAEAVLNSKSHYRGIENVFRAAIQGVQDASPADLAATLKRMGEAKIPSEAAKTQSQLGWHTYAKMIAAYRQKMADKDDEEHKQAMALVKKSLAGKGGKDIAEKLRGLIGGKESSVKEDALDASTKFYNAVREHIPTLPELPSHGATLGRVILAAQAVEAENKKLAVKAAKSKKSAKFSEGEGDEEAKGLDPDAIFTSGIADPAADVAAWWTQKVYFDSVPMSRADMFRKLQTCEGITEKDARFSLSYAEIAEGPGGMPPEFWDEEVWCDGQVMSRAAAARKWAEQGSDAAEIKQALFAANPAGEKGDLDPDGHWVTVKGQHLHITGEDEIDAGGHPALREALAKGGLKAKGDGEGGSSSAAAKEPWQMTRKEYADLARHAYQLRKLQRNGGNYTSASAEEGRDKGDAIPAHIWESIKGKGTKTFEGGTVTGLREKIAKSLKHKEAVAAALEAGKSVPPEVLKNYPDLKNKAKAGQETGKPAMSTTYPKITAQEEKDFFEYARKHGRTTGERTRLFGDAANKLHHERLAQEADAADKADEKKEPKAKSVAIHESDIDLARLNDPKIRIEHIDIPARIGTAYGDFPARSQLVVHTGGGSGTNEYLKSLGFSNWGGSSDYLGTVVPSADYYNHPASKLKEPPKEPWKMTREEWMKHGKEYSAEGKDTKGNAGIQFSARPFYGSTEKKPRSDNLHKFHINHAIDKGYDVPDEVLADYPEQRKQMDELTKIMEKRRADARASEPSSPAAAEEPAGGKSEGKEIWQMTHQEAAGSPLVSKENYSIGPANYAKNSMAVKIESDGSGWKTRAAYLAGAIGGRWSNREKAYIMSPKKAERLKKLIEEGWSANSSGELVKPGGHHREEVEKAVAEGKPVPKHVLADYPDLAKKPKSHVAESEPKETEPKPLPSHQTVVDDLSKVLAGKRHTQGSLEKAVPHLPPAMVQKVVSHLYKTGYISTQIKKDNATGDVESFRSSHTPNVLKSAIKKALVDIKYPDKAS